MTDARSGGERSPVFAGRDAFVLPGAGIAGRGLRRGARAARGARRRHACRRGACWRRLEPSAIVGFGGYPSVPPVLAARLLRPAPARDPARAERGARPRQPRCWPASPTGWRSACRRPCACRAARPHASPATRCGPRSRRWPASPTRRREPGGPIRLLVTGGSQGARVFSDALPARARACSAPGCGPGCASTQQCRPEDLERVRAAYAGLGVEAELSPFFPDIAARLAAAHFVVARAGASTVAELAVAGRPALLVPFPHAIDAHQIYNAMRRRRRWCWSRRSSSSRPQVLAEALAQRLGCPDMLAVQAHAMARRTASRTRAQSRLADLRRTRGTAGDHGMRALPLGIGTIHFVGIGGIGMSGIAEVLHTLGYAVQGSDIADNDNVKRLRDAGIPVAIGHDERNVANAQVVVVSTAVKRDNPEVVGRPRPAGPGGAPGRDAGRADAAEMGDRGRRHARQDDDHQPGRRRARGRATSTRP